MDFEIKESAPVPGTVHRPPLHTRQAGSPFYLFQIFLRLGTTDTDEWEDLLTVYDKYPLEELIIHPRIQKDFYKYTPRMECYRTAYETSRCSLCYNGDIFSPDDFKNLCREFPDTEKVMLGRGVLQNPWLIGMLRSADPAGGEASAPDKELLHARSEERRLPIRRNI